MCVLNVHLSALVLSKLNSPNMLLSRTLCALDNALDTVFNFQFSKHHKRNGYAR